MRHRWTVPIVAVLLAGAAQAEVLTVSAAASLQNAFQEIGTSFEQARPGTTVQFNFAASGPLVAQMRQGAPVDVLATADAATMDRAQAGGLVNPATRADFAGNELVVAVPAARPLPLKALADLARPDVRRIALGTPSSVPAGAYSRDALTAAGLWEPLSPRFVQADNVRQVLNYLSRGEVDAGFIYRTDALLDPRTVRIAFAVPLPAAVRYPIARSARAASPDVADAFIRHVTGPDGQRILQRHGFAAP